MTKLSVSMTTRITREGRSIVLSVDNHKFNTDWGIAKEPAIEKKFADNFPPGTGSDAKRTQDEIRDPEATAS